MLLRPIVRVVGDSAFLVGGYGITLHYPFDGGLAVDHILVSFGRYALYGDGVVVVDDAFVGSFAVNLAEAHFLHPVIDAVAFVGQRSMEHEALLVGFYRFIIQVQIRQRTSGFAECPEVVRFLYQRQARQRLF